jgi:hypothetical protein
MDIGGFNVLRILGIRIRASRSDTPPSNPLPFYATTKIHGGAIQVVLGQECVA